MQEIEAGVVPDASAVEEQGKGKGKKGKGRSRKARSASTQSVDQTRVFNFRNEGRTTAAAAMDTAIEIDDTQAAASPEVPSAETQEDVVPEVTSAEDAAPEVTSAETQAAASLEVPSAEIQAAAAPEVPSVETEAPPAVEVPSVETEAPAATEVPSVETQEDAALEVRSAQTEARTIPEVPRSWTKDPAALAVPSAETQAPVATGAPLANTVAPAAADIGAAPLAETHGATGPGQAAPSRETSALALVGRGTPQTALVSNLECDCLCATCGKLFNLEDVTVISKRDGTWRCMKCRTRVTQLFRVMGCWPTDEFRTLPGELQQSFFANLHEIQGQAAVKTYCQANLTQFSMAEENYELGGKCLPLGVWEKKGFDKVSIEQQTAAHNRMMDPTYGWELFRVAIKSVGNSGRKGYSMDKSWQTKRKRLELGDGLPKLTDGSADLGGVQRSDPPPLQLGAGSSSASSPAALAAAAASSTSSKSSSSDESSSSSSASSSDSSSSSSKKRKRDKSGKHAKKSKKSKKDKKARKKKAKKAKKDKKDKAEKKQQEREQKEAEKLLEKERKKAEVAKVQLASNIHKRINVPKASIDLLLQNSSAIYIPEPVIQKAKTMLESLVTVATEATNQSDGRSREPLAQHCYRHEGCQIKGAPRRFYSATFGAAAQADQEGDVIANRARF